jgi:hypothetical protein
MDAAERHNRIAMEAYRRFESRAGGTTDPLEDWLEAERVVDAELARASGSQTRASFLGSMAVVIEQGRAVLDELGRLAAAAGSSARSSYEEQKAALKPKVEAAAERLHEIREQGDVAWNHLSDGAEKAAAELRVAVQKAFSTFQRPEGG